MRETKYIIVDPFCVHNFSIEECDNKCKCNQWLSINDSVLKQYIVK
jgi:hypothetical protein